MTWSRFDDAAPKHPKAIAAGNDAWALWAGAVMYCNRYLTDGFVPTAALATECLPEPITAAKARKLAQRLVDAKLRVGGPGLFVVVDGGFMVHDFLEWNPCKVDVESKRKADRDRKKRPADSGSDSGGKSPGIPSGNPTGSRADSGSDSTGSRGSARALPARPAQPIPTATTEPVVVALAERARKVLENPHDGHWRKPSKWPEVLAVCEAWSFGMVSKLRDFGDSDLTAILQAFADGYTVEQLVEAGRLAQSSPYFAKLERPGPASFTAPVLRRLLNPSTPRSGTRPEYGSDEEWSAGA